MPNIFTNKNEEIELNNPFPAASDENDEVNLINMIMNTEIDSEELLKKEAELFLETGNYQWNEGRCNVRVSFYDTDKKSTDIAQKKGFDKGRCMIQVSGIAYNVSTGKRGRFQFTCSPDVRKAGNGEDDFFSKAYVQVTSFYFKKYIEKPKKESDLVDLLNSAMYSMYITRGRNGGNYLQKLNPL